MRGRKPKPTGAKIAAGNPGKRRIKQCVIAPRGELRPPEFFGEEEKEVWNETLASSARGVIKPADRELLIAFCEQVVIRRQAMRELKAVADDNRKPDGTTTCMSVETVRGWVKNPLVTVLDACAKNIRALASELGLSPASRERLSSGDQADLFKNDPWAQFDSPPPEQKTQ